MPAAMACDLFSISMVHNVSPANKAWGRGPQSIHNSGRGLQSGRARGRGTPSKGRPAVRVSSPPAKREGGRREATQGGFSYRAHRAPAALALEEMLDERMLELGHLARRAADQHLLLGQHGHARGQGDRKSTRLNSSHLVISYAVFCLKKKKYSHDHDQCHINGDCNDPD